MEKHMSEFTKVSQIETVGDAFEAQIPDGWQQGRGAYGGLTLGILYRAIRASEEDPDRVLRVLTGNLIGPVDVGSAQVDVDVLRRGNNLTSLDARLAQNGQTLARASAILSKSREVGDTGIKSHPLPDAPDWTTLDPVPVQPPLGPVFAKHYEYRVFGTFPFSGGSNPVADGYVRPVDAEGVHDHASLLGLLDAFWPTYLALLTQPRPTVTVSFTSEFFVDPTTLDASVPLRHHAHAMAEHDGFFLEFRELWHNDTLVAMNQQTFAII